MREIMPWLLSAVGLAVFFYFVLRKKKQAEEVHVPGSGSNADLILDLKRKRLYVAMKEHFLEETKSEEDWLIFEFIDGLPGGGDRSRQALEKKISVAFKISPGEATTRLDKVLDAVQTVKKRAGESPD